MATRVHRLNLPNMVDQQLKGVPMKTYFNPIIVREEIGADNKKPGGSKNIISSSLNSLMATVHRKLRTRKFRALQKRQTDRAEAENALKSATHEQNSNANSNAQPKINKNAKQTKGGHKSKSKNEHSKTNNQQKKPVSQVTTTKTKSIPFGSATPRSVTQVDNKTIPQIKAVRTLRARVRPIRLTAAPQTQRNTKVLGNHRRIEEMRRQKRILEDMLDEHEKLRRDRHTIAVEIQSMRERLTDIRRKLDVSLRKLQSTPISKISMKPIMGSNINGLTVVRSKQR